MEKMNLREFTVAYTLEGEGIPLVLIHGYPLDHSIWDPIVPLLTGSYKVIVPDLRGFGAHPHRQSREKNCFTARNRT